jgi:hypothetical protein
MEAFFTLYERGMYCATTVVMLAAIAVLYYYYYYSVPALASLQLGGSPVQPSRTPEMLEKLFLSGWHCPLISVCMKILQKGVYRKPQMGFDIGM